MAWIRRKLRNESVYVRVDGNGQPAPGADGRVDIRYKPSPAAKVYRAALRTLTPTDDPGDEIPTELPGVDNSDSADNGASGEGATGKAARSTARASAGPGLPVHAPSV
jgi:hypothetical protein